jgi:hypothetical protein
VVCISNVVPSGSGMAESPLLEAADETAGIQSAAAIITPAHNGPTRLLNRFTVRSLRCGEW